MKAKKYFDKKGRQIKAWDVLKVYHFTDPSGHKYFMYKWVKPSKKDGLLFQSLGAPERGKHHFYRPSQVADEQGNLKDTEVLNWRYRT